MTITGTVATSFFASSMLDTANTNIAQAFLAVERTRNNQLALAGGALDVGHIG